MCVVNLHLVAMEVLTRKILIKEEIAFVIRRQYFVPVSSIVVTSASVVLMMSISRLCVFSELEPNSLVTREAMVEVSIHYLHFFR